MAGYITHGQEKSVVLSVSQVDALVAGGQRRRGAAVPAAPAGWTALSPPKRWRRG